MQQFILNHNNVEDIIPKKSELAEKTLNLLIVQILVLYRDITSQQQTNLNRDIIFSSIIQEDKDQHTEIQYGEMILRFTQIILLIQFTGSNLNQLSKIKDKDKSIDEDIKTVYQLQIIFIINVFIQSIQQFTLLQGAYLFVIVFIILEIVSRSIISQSIKIFLMSLSLLVPIISTQNFQQKNGQLLETRYSIFFFLWFGQKLSEEQGRILYQRQIKILDQMNKEKDLKLIKLLHDIQNPVQSINITLDNNDPQIDDQDDNNNQVVLNDDGLINNNQKFDSISNFNQKDKIIDDVNQLQNTLNSIKYEMKIQHQITQNEPINVVSTQRFFTKIIKQNLNLATNGSNGIRLDIPENQVHQKISIKRESVELLVNNILNLNLKNINNGIVGIKILKDEINNVCDFEKMIVSGSEKNPILKQFIIQIYNSNMNKRIEEQTIMDVFTFSTFSLLCSKSGIILKQTESFNFCKLQIPYNVSITDQNNYVNECQCNWSNNKLLNYQINDNHVCNTAIIVEDHPNILKSYQKIMTDANFPHKAFLNGKDALNQIKTIKCKHNCKILVQTDLNMPYLDGLRMISSIKELELKNEFKIVMISAEDNDYSIINNSVDEFYVKPINSSKFRQIYKDYQEINKTESQNIITIGYQHQKNLQ